MNIPCILIPALVGLICGILGYLIGKMNSKDGNDSKSVELESELNKCLSITQKLKAKIVTLDSDLELCKSNGVKLNTKISNLEARSTSETNNVSSFASKVTPIVLFNSELASSVFGKKIKINDLKIVEGIGPKIEELFNYAGINTWLTLSETSTEKLQAILDAAGEGFSLHNPGTWARQAELAFLGKWQELKEWQDILDGGKE